MTHPGQSDFKTRLRKELLELRDRRLKLSLFIGSDGFYGLPLDEQHRLREQSKAMSDYDHILSRRATALGIAHPPTGAARVREGISDKEYAALDALAKVTQERDTLNARIEFIAEERDAAKRDALGRFHDLTGKQAKAIREAATHLGIEQGGMRLGEVVAAVAAQVQALPSQAQAHPPTGAARVRDDPRSVEP
jgi:hypothetical protein